VYPNDSKAKIKVDDDIKQLFRGIELPRDVVYIEKELQKNGRKPMTNTAKRQAAAQINGVKPKAKPKKQREITKRTRITMRICQSCFRISTLHWSQLSTHWAARCT
jgi:transcription initiation factor TFIIE subunit beta